MADILKAGIAGAGWPGKAHARGYLASGGYRLVAVADLIPSRRKEAMEQFRIPAEYAAWEDLVADPGIDVISICLPTHLHAEAAVAALRKGKHIVCERPPALTAAQARRIAAAAEKAGRQVLYAFQRRFGGAELAAKQALTKGYAGEPYHARAVWTRTRAVPIGTGWFTDRERSGGGALMDLGSAMLDLAWHLLGEPEPAAVFAATHHRLGRLVPEATPFDVEESATALLRFQNGATLELTASWALNQSPAQNGVVCRVHGTQGAIEVYTPRGPIMHRGFDATGAKSTQTPLKLPKMAGHAALLRHFRECVLGKATPLCGPRQGIILMQMLDALYKSTQSARSVQV